MATVLFVFLHRRHVKRLRREDANDPHKSLDFGWDPSNSSKANKRGESRKGKPEMIATDMNMDPGSRKERGVSMDLDVGSPYLLPPGIHGSSESLNPMSRTIHSQDDRYRPATNYNPNDNASLHSTQTKRYGDDAASFTTSGTTRHGQRDEMRQDLLGNAQRMSRSMPPKNGNPVPQMQAPEPAQEMPRKPLPSNPATPASAGLAPVAPRSDPRDSYQVGDDLRKSNNYLGAFIHSRDPSVDVRSPESEKSQYATPGELPSTPCSTLQQPDSRKSPPPAITTGADPARTPRQQSLRSSKQASIEQNFFDDASDYGEGIKVTPASPGSSQHDRHSNNRGSSQEYMPPIDEYSLGVGERDFSYDVRRISGVRPLPPDDPLDNPEQRANRIRSFYKEYFDDSKPAPAPAAAAYYEDYDENYLGDGAIFDPASGQLVSTGEIPYAEPYGRRAMTPPPRVGGRRHAATMSSSSRLMPPTPRAFSSASSDRSGPGGPGRPLPKKKMPPPQPLRVLPTPHMLKEDAFALPIDFAPPTSARDRQAGRPESPRGGMRPFSPGVRAHTPLARSYDDLAVMPSP